MINQAAKTPNSREPSQSAHSDPHKVPGCFGVVVAVIGLDADVRCKAQGIELPDYPRLADIGASEAFLRLIGDDAPQLSGGKAYRNRHGCRPWNIGNLIENEGGRQNERLVQIIQQHLVHDQRLASKFAQTDVLGGAMFEGIAPR